MFDIPLWLVFALSSPLFWAMVYVLDAYCVEEVFDRPWIGSVTSSLSMLLALPALLAGLLLQNVAPMSTETIVLGLLSGVLFMVGQLFYFRAISLSESGIVAAYLNVLPVLLLVIGYLFFGERLESFKYLGCLLLVICSVWFCLLDQNRQQRWVALALMLIATISQVGYFLILDHALEQCPPFQMFVLVTCSMILSGFVPLGLAENRRVFRHNWPRIRRALWFLVAIELANLLAVATNNYALKLGQASLVSTVEACGPAFTFVLSALLYSRFRRYGEREALQRLPAKLALVGGMSVGVYWVS